MCGVLFLLSFITIRTLAAQFDNGVTDEGTSNHQIYVKFKSFVVRYNRSYINDPEEYRYRMSVFEDSIKRQQMLNERERKLNGNAIYGINKFSDWTREEFRAYLSKFEYSTSLPPSPSTSCCDIYFNSSSLLKASWDWRKTQKVTSVKSQGNCGSCWAFSAAGVVETQWAITKKLPKAIELSVQELVSCSQSAGCKGGTIIGTLKWLKSARYWNKSKIEKVYLLPASEYPYEEKESSCKYLDIEPKCGAQITCACSRNFTKKEVELANYVSSTGSVGIGVNAVLWHDYIGGIIQHHCSDAVIDHAVIIEGYDASGDIPFWIVRNSWGSDFGDNGYLYIKMFGNICGIAERVSFVKV